MAPKPGARHKKKIARGFTAQTNRLQPTYRTARDACLTILIQRIKTLALVDPPTPEIADLLRQTIGNCGMRSLGLRCNGDFDNVTFDFLLSPLGTGGGGMSDPIGR